MRSALRKGEILIVETHPHWLALARPFLALLVTGGAVYAVAQLAPGAVGYVTVLPILSFLWLVWSVLKRRFNVWAVTNLRVVDEHGVIARHAKESPLDKINNITVEQSILGRIFRYGDLRIQTAAEAGETVYRMVSNPRRLHEAISDARQRLHPAPPPPAAEEETRECPHCAERIKARAKVCRYCGREVTPEAGERPSAAAE